MRDPPAGLPSLPARIVLCDETDSYLADLREGNPFDLAAARATTFGALKRVAAISTPTYAGQSLIERLYLETDQRKYIRALSILRFSANADMGKPALGAWGAGNGALPLLELHSRG